MTEEILIEDEQNDDDKTPLETPSDTPESDNDSDGSPELAEESENEDGDATDDDGGEEEENDAEDETPPQKAKAPVYTPEQQAHINKLIQSAHIKERVKREKSDEQLALTQRQLKELQDFVDQDTERHKSLKTALDKDDLLDESVRGLADRPEPPKINGNGRIRELHKWGDDEFQLDGNELTYKLHAATGQAGILQGQRITMMIQNGDLPRDIVPLANRLDNSAEFIALLASSPDVLAQVQLAMYKAQNFDEFESQVKDVLKRGPSPAAKAPAKKKPEPNAKLKAKPSSGNKDDEDVVYVD